VVLLCKLLFQVHLIKLTEVHVQKTRMVILGMTGNMLASDEEILVRVGFVPYQVGATSLFFR
jgi:hypothetical protein